jgi:hypothetical protein
MIGSRLLQSASSPSRSSALGVHRMPPAAQAAPPVVATGVGDAHDELGRCRSSTTRQSSKCWRTASGPSSPISALGCRRSPRSTSPPRICSSSPARARQAAVDDLRSAVTGSINATDRLQRAVCVPQGPGPPSYGGSTPTPATTRRAARRPHRPRQGPPSTTCCGSCTRRPAPGRPLRLSVTCSTSRPATRTTTSTAVRAAGSSASQPPAPPPGVHGRGPLRDRRARRRHPARRLRRLRR